jgi:ABC-2 type transport system ATP-binding protein
VFVTTADAGGDAAFRAIPGVESVSWHEGTSTIRGTGNLVTHVIGCLAEHRMQVADFRTERATLEDVFLKLTGHSIRN